MQSTCALHFNLHEIVILIRFHEVVRLVKREAHVNFHGETELGWASLIQFCFVKILSLFAGCLRGVKTDYND